VAASLKIKEAIPAVMPVTVEPLTAATAGLLLLHTPPVTGVSSKVLPTPTNVSKTATSGNGKTSICRLAVAVNPLASVMVTV
jgi:hypothetical protein